jgi:predicted HicB family RNase H-like nuclease
MAAATKTPTPPKRATKKVAAPVTPVRRERGQIQIRLSQDLVDRLGVEAERRRVSKTFLVEQMIATSIERWEEQEITTV